MHQKAWMPSSNRYRGSDVSNYCFKEMLPRNFRPENNFFVWLWWWLLLLSTRVSKESDDLTFLLVFTIHWIMFSSVWNMSIQLKIIAGSRLLRTAQRSSRGIHQHHRKSFCKRPPLGRLLKIAGHHYLLEE